MSATVVGSTVRRPAGPWTPAVHALLRHFERVGFDGAPRALGVEGDEEILSFVPGAASVDPADEIVAEVGALVHRMHEAQIGFVPPVDAAWQQMPRAVAGDEVVCHNDVLGSNVLFRDGLPAALIDWELAAPGPRAVDLAGAASHWVPLRPDEDAERHGFPTDRRRERLKLLLTAYGFGQEPTMFLGVVADVWRTWHEAYRVWGGIERRRHWAQAYDAGRCQYIARNLDWMLANRAALA